MHLDTSGLLFDISMAVVVLAGIVSMSIPAMALAGVALILGLLLKFWDSPRWT
ncbi:MAG: hypothetical protein WAY93_07090 [Atopobiaceae bacterium]|jgi:hypothetical protein|nr:hypothetical protein [Atopobiaceae bacterium]